jgi:dolichyl-diphosphooligosaccharide--protein glycosyltransferase
LLGRCLTSPEKKAHDIVKHLADYVLIWAGGGGDDLAKSPHMARIGNSVFEDICPGDPTCQKFGFTDRQMTPTPMMGASLLYKLHQNRVNPAVTVNSSLFREVFISKYGKLRIYQVNSSWCCWCWSWCWCWCWCCCCCCWCCCCCCCCSSCLLTLPYL